MIVSNWTMRRFHIASLLVLVCARVVPCMPVVSPPPPPAAPMGDAGGSGSDSDPLTDEPEQQTRPSPIPTTPQAESIREPERDPIGEEGTYFQGDIRLRPDDDPYDLYRISFTRVEKRMAFDREGSGGSNMDNLDSVNSSRLWTDGIIPYRFASHLSMMYRHYFSEAMYEWSRRTCLNFVQIGDVNITETNYVIFTDTEGCSSYVGMIGGAQEVSIDARCVGKGSAAKGHAMHEIGHLVGLWHEHSRWDRDSYIRIARENIRDNAYYNYGTISREKWPSIDDPGYDLLSIMHYGAKSFSKNNNDTIEIIVRVPDCVVNNMGQRRKPSRKDIIKTNRMYTCENETREDESCDVTTASPSPSPSPPSPPPPPTTSDRLLNNDSLRLSTNPETGEYLECNERRCRRKRCRHSIYLNTYRCDPSFSFIITHHTQRNNQKIKNNDVVNLRSLHNSLSWLTCSGHNICSISECQVNDGGQNVSVVSDCNNQQFVVVSSKAILRENRSFQLKHPTNETYLYCTEKWCDLLPQCPDGQVESNSNDIDEVTCHSPTNFYVKKIEE